MGEAVYYFKAVFKTKREAREALKKFKEYLKQHTQAFNYWTKNRGSPNPDKVLADLKRRYPLAMKFVKVDKVPKGDFELNILSGQLLDFSSEIREVDVYENEVHIRAEVWHCDDWDHMVRFARSLGAVGADWISNEEGPDFYDLINVG